MTTVPNMDKKLLVQKFGGTSLADLAGFEASAAVIGRYTDEHRVVVVLSAVTGTERKRHP
jgi:aspartokinase